MARDDDLDNDDPRGRRQAADAAADRERRQKFADQRAVKAALAVAAALDRSARLPDPYTDPAVCAIWSRGKPQ